MFLTGSTFLNYKVYPSLDLERFSWFGAILESSFSIVEIECSCYSTSCWYFFYVWIYSLKYSWLQAYRDRVYTGLSKYHGTPIGADNPRRRQKRTSTSTSILKKKNNVTDNPAGNKRKASTPRSRIKRSDAPIYKDPLASSKLQMIKNIRADRENKKAEAVTRAK